MKRSILRTLVFGSAFLLGCMFSFDNRLSLWPAIPNVVFTEIEDVRCKHGAELNEAGDVVCVGMDE